MEYLGETVGVFTTQHGYILVRTAVIALKYTTRSAMNSSSSSSYFSLGTFVSNSRDVTCYTGCVPCRIVVV